MADRYWVGGSGLWDTSPAINWATTSGGTGGASTPTSADDVYFDANSGTVNVTVMVSANVNSLNFTGFTGSISNSRGFSVRTAITFSSTMRLDGSINFNSPAASNISVFGQTPARADSVFYPNLVVSAGTTYNIIGDVKFGNISLFSTGGSVVVSNGNPLIAEDISLMSTTSIDSPNGITVGGLSISDDGVITGPISISEVKANKATLSSRQCFLILSGFQTITRNISIKSDVQTLVLSNAAGNQLFLDFERGGNGIQVTSNGGIQSSVIHGITRSGAGNDNFIYLGSNTVPYGISLNFASNTILNNFIVQSVASIGTGIVQFNNSVDMNGPAQPKLIIKPTAIIESTHIKLDTEFYYSVIPAIPVIIGINQPTLPVFGEYYEAWPRLEDPDQDINITWEISYSGTVPSWAEFEYGYLYGTVTDAYADYGTVTFTGTNSKGTDSISFPLKARSMEFTNTPSVGQSGQEFTFNPGATSNITDIISSTFALTIPPAEIPLELTINPSTGVVSGTLPPVNVDTEYTFSITWTVVDSDGPRIITNTYTISVSAPVYGYQTYITQGTYSFVVPDNVNAVSAVTIGAGGGGGGRTYNETGGGGGGGALSYSNDIPVTPGETLTIEVGAAGQMGGPQPPYGSSGLSGGFSSIRRGSTNLLMAAGGGGGQYSASSSPAQRGEPGLAGNGVGQVKFSGEGNGGTPAQGSAATYVGNGGPPASGTSPDGPNIVSNIGLGGMGAITANGWGTSGAPGAVRLIWGDGYNYPSPTEMILDVPYTNSGTYSFVVPYNVDKISAVVIGAGGGGGGSSNGIGVGGNGGGGGALSYSNDIPVTPGETLTVIIGNSGVAGAATSVGGDGGLGETTQILRGSTVLLSAVGGGGGLYDTRGAVPGVGGAASSGVGNVRYSGAVGAVRNNTGSPATGGSAGSYTGNGVGFGTGAGIYGTEVAGQWGMGGQGKAHGSSGTGSPGQRGAARIMWAKNKSFPSNARLTI